MFNFVKSLISGPAEEWPIGALWCSPTYGEDTVVFVEAEISCEAVPDRLNKYQISIHAKNAPDNNEPNLYVFPITMEMVLQDMDTYLQWNSVERRGDRYAFQFDKEDGVVTTFKDLVFRMLASTYTQLPMDLIATAHVKETKDEVEKLNLKLKDERKTNPTVKPIERTPQAGTHARHVYASERSPTPPVDDIYENSTPIHDTVVSTPPSQRKSTSPATPQHKYQYPSLGEEAPSSYTKVPRVNVINATPMKTPRSVQEPDTSHSQVPLVFEPTQPLSKYIPEGEKLNECTGEFYSYAVNYGKFVPVVEGCAFTLSALPKNRLRLDVHKDGQLWYTQSPDMGMNLFPVKKDLIIIWNGERLGVGGSFGFKFNKAIEYRKFQTKIYSAMYAQLSELSNSKALEEDNMDYVYAMGGADMMDIDDDESTGYRRSVLSDVDEESDEDSEDEDALNETFCETGTNSKNRGLAVAFNHNRTFVNQKGGIGVFRNNMDDGTMQHITTIKANKFKSNGKAFNAESMMLHQGDKQMLMMDPINDNKSIYRMDMNRGEVVEEWKTHDIIGVEKIAPSTKYAQRTDEDILVGLNKNRVMMLDGRLSGDKVVTDQSYGYAANTKPQLSCLHTTAAGEVVIGSEKGEIRMFNKINMRAKTLLPGFGEPITGIDVSADGKYILATCQKYLVFIPTTFIDRNGNETIGFKKSMPKGVRPKPIVLRLSPDHVAIMQSSVDFTPARFNIGEGQEEVICASSGQYVVQWNVADVLKHNITNYVLKKYKDDVVGDMFVFNNSDKVVVALTGDITMSKKQMFKTPNKMIRSMSNLNKHNIVASPY
eukprot:CFRG8365T1